MISAAVRFVQRTFQLQRTQSVNAGVAVEGDWSNQIYCVRAIPRYNGFNLFGQKIVCFDRLQGREHKATRKISTLQDTPHRFSVVHSLSAE